LFFVQEYLAFESKEPFIRISQSPSFAYTTCIKKCVCVQCVFTLSTSCSHLEWEHSLEDHSDPGTVHYPDSMYRGPDLGWHYNISTRFAHQRQTQFMNIQNSRIWALLPEMTHGSKPLLFSLRSHCPT